MEDQLKSSYSFNIEIAKIVDIDAATLYNYFIFWIEHNKKKQKDADRDGFWWSYTTYKKITKTYPMWNRQKICRLVKKLVDYDLIRTGNYNKWKPDRTTWYTVGEKSPHYQDYIITNDAKPIDSAFPKNGDPFPKYGNSTFPTFDTAIEIKEEVKEEDIYIHTNTVNKEMNYKKNMFSFKDIHALNSDFDAVWKIYPKRQGANTRESAFSAYRYARNNGHSAAEILLGVENYAKECDSESLCITNTRFVKSTANFLNQKCFIDYQVWKEVKEVKNVDKGVEAYKKEMGLL